MYAFEAGYLTGATITEKRAAAGGIARGVKAIGRGLAGTGQFMVKHPKSSLALGAGAVGAGVAGAQLAKTNPHTGRSHAATFARQYL